MEINTSSNLSYLNNQKLTSNKVEVKKTDDKLSKEEKEKVTQLKKEDRRVRTHENAHKAAAGNLSKGSPNYDYKMGPDGKKYAVSGNVHIDSAEVPNDPEATIEKAQNIKKVAMAPADPSGQDLKVAREASRMESKARKELVENDNEDNNSIQQKLNSTYNSENSKSNYDVFV